MACQISTHAPRVRRDYEPGHVIIVAHISTHAPRVRRDGKTEKEKTMSFDFYSRASCEARRVLFDVLFRVSDFYSRASCEARQKWLAMDK